MRALDVQPLGDTDGDLLRSEAGARWDLPDESFIRWWRRLPEEDRSEFSTIYGGDELLARFVCALDYLTIMQARPQSGSTIVEAYSIAARVQPDSETARSGAAACWKHDAVQALLDRLRYRSNRQASARITARTTAVIEEMLLAVQGEDASIKEKGEAVRSALSFMKMVSDEDVQERVERTKRGFIAARKELTDKEEEKPTLDQARVYIEMLRGQFGTETIRALAGGRSDVIDAKLAEGQE